MSLQHFLWGGGENFEKFFLIDININQKIAGFDCVMLGILPPEDPSKTLTAPGVLRAFYNYLDGFEQVCSYISPVI